MAALASVNRLTIHHSRTRIHEPNPGTHPSRHGRTRDQIPEPDVTNSPCPQTRTLLNPLTDASSIQPPRCARPGEDELRRS